MKLFTKHNFTTSSSSSQKPFKPTSSRIIAFCKSGSLFSALKLLNETDSINFSINVKPLVYASLLQTATKLKSFNHGIQPHCHIHKSGLLANSLVRVNPRKSLDYFREMLGDGIEANDFTLSAGIRACFGIGDVKISKCFHGVVLRGGFELNYLIASSLIDAYGKNGWLGYARHVFDELPEPDAVCWSSMISCFTKNDMYEEVTVLSRMPQIKNL